MIYEEIITLQVVDVEVQYTETVKRRIEFLGLDFVAVINKVLAKPLHALDPYIKYEIKEVFKFENFQKLLRISLDLQYRTQSMHTHAIEIHYGEFASGINIVMALSAVIDKLKDNMRETVFTNGLSRMIQNAGNIATLDNFIETVKEHSFMPGNDLYNSNALAGECGEVANICKKIHILLNHPDGMHDKTLTEEHFRKKELEELGDVFFYFIRKMLDNGATLGQVMEHQIVKLKFQAIEYGRTFTK